MVRAGEDRNVLKWPHEGLNVYYIGSYQGCGCGWSATGDWDEPSDRDAKTEDRLELGRILRVIDLKHSWFVVCWEGDQGESIQPAKTISVDQIEDPQFEFEELQQYRVAQ